MIKVSVLYPHDKSKKFDFEYYMDHHMPLVKEKLGAACKGAEVDKGIEGGRPGSDPVYVVVAHMLFDSHEAYVNAFAPVGKEIMADVPNFTDITPQVQVSDVYT